MSPVTTLAAPREVRPGRPSASARSRDAAPLAGLFVALVLAIAPAWNPVWYQDDQLPTLFRTFHTDLAHHWSVAYPRLAPELGFGYGRLLHQFYPPFGVELATWLHTLGLGYVDAARAIFSLCLLSSGLGMYAFARAVLGGPWPAALAAIGFAWAPYVLLDAHKGGVLGESIAMALMPWALLALDRLVRAGGWSAFGASAGTLALVVLGHNITALFFVGLVSLYALLLSVRAWLGAPRPARRTAIWRLVQAAGAVGLAMALAAIYWVPALLELPFSRVSDQRTGEFTVTRYLLSPLELLQPLPLFDYYVEAVPRYGLVSALLIMVAILLSLVAILRRPTNMAAVVGRLIGPDRLVVGAFGLCFLVVMSLQLRASEAVWETVPLISYVQFPQRLFVFGSFAGAIVLGSVPWAVKSLTGRHSIAIASGLLTALTLGLTSLPGIYWTWPVAGSHVIEEEQVGIGTAAERRLSERRAFDDYFPIWVSEDANQITRPPSPNRTELYGSASPGPAPRVSIVERGYLHLVLRTEADVRSTLVLHQFYFPGWQATAAGSPLEVGPSGPLGLVSVTIPPGQHLVRVWFGETPLRLAVTGVSLVGVVLLLAILARGVGLRRLTLATAALILVAVGPRLLHDRLQVAERPAPRSVEADVTPAARIVAFELEERPVRSGETVPITLLWQSRGYTSRDLQSGVRLVPAGGGQALAERWGRPNRERTPTGKWLIGEIVPDTLLLRIPQAAPPGRYRLLAGLRDPDVTDRAPLGLVEIGELEVR